LQKILDTTRDGEKACRRKGLNGVYRCYKSDALWRMGLAGRPEIRPPGRKFNLISDVVDQASSF
jgi:hypothetical protein